VWHQFCDDVYSCFNAVLTCDEQMDRKKQGLNIHHASLVLHCKNLIQLSPKIFFFWNKQRKKFSGHLANSSSLCVCMSSSRIIEAFADAVGINLDKLCRMVCGRRVRVEHALTTGSKKEYKYTVRSRYDRRYRCTVLCIFLIRLHSHIVHIIELSWVLAELFEKYRDVP